MEETKRTLERIDILSSLVIAAFEDKGRDKDNKVEFRDICKLLGKLAKFLDLDDFSISPGAEYSEDVSRWLSNMDDSDYLTMSGTKIIFQENGLQFCREHFLRARFDSIKKVEMERIIHVFGIDLENVQSSFWKNSKKIL